MGTRANAIYSGEMASEVRGMIDAHVHHNGINTWPWPLLYEALLNLRKYDDELLSIEDRWNNELSSMSIEELTLEERKELLIAESEVRADFVRPAHFTNINQFLDIINQKGSMLQIAYPNQQELRNKLSNLSEIRKNYKESKIKKNDIEETINSRYEFFGEKTGISGKDTVDLGRLLVSLNRNSTDEYKFFAGIRLMAKITEEREILLNKERGRRAPPVMENEPEERRGPKRDIWNRQVRTWPARSDIQKNELRRWFDLEREEAELKNKLHEHDPRLIIALTMDMEFAHISGYDGEMIYQQRGRDVVYKI
ncbi:MAG: hypothetical protein LBC70_09640, partial [Chitinispirillales bacterium]|nr:hypothetical protein [Chitinispirillales bacterium]